MAKQFRQPPAIIADLRLLHPLAREPFQKMLDELERAFEAGATNTDFIPFETYRSPERQIELYRQQPPVTKVREWGSAHQFGLAVDFVANDDDPWDDDHDWAFLKKVAEKHGLTVPISWDLGHVEHPLYRQKYHFDYPKAPPKPVKAAMPLFQDEDEDEPYDPDR